MAQQKDVTNSQAIVKSFKIYHNTVKDFKYVQFFFYSRNYFKSFYNCNS